MNVEEFVRRLCIGVIDDGKVSERERELLDKIGGLLGMDSAKMDAILGELVEMDEQRLFERGRNEFEPQMAYKLAVRLSAADGTVSAREKELILALKRLFGISEFVHEALLEQLGIKGYFEED